MFCCSSKKDPTPAAGSKPEAKAPEVVVAPFDFATAGQETLSLHAGHDIDPTQSRQVPVYRTTSYTFKSTEHAANLFGLKELGNIYSRLMNPTNDVLEKRIAALEGGAAALAVSSGTTAIYYSILNVAAGAGTPLVGVDCMKHGDEIVASSALYGGSFTMLHDILPQSHNIKTHFVDIRKPETVEAAITPRTRAIFTEVIGNPALDFADVSAIAAIAHKHNLPLIVDSTFTPPSLFQPLKHGADIVVHSLTKWIGGHGAAIGGIVVDSGKFNWKDPKFALFNEPEASYHNLRFAHDLGPLAPLAFILRMRLIPLRNLGGCLSPDNSWIHLIGLETLSLRMERHSQNALAVAKFLSTHANVAWVRYPGLPSDPSYPVASKYLTDGLFGGMVVFGVKGGAKAGQKFIESLKLFSHLANVGDAKSLAIHPATTTHSQLTEEQQLAGGISPDLVRLSIGIESEQDIIADLQGALSKI